MLLLCCFEICFFILLVGECLKSCVIVVLVLVLMVCGFGGGNCVLVLCRVVCSVLSCCMV